MVNLTAILKVLGIAFACGAALAVTNWLTADRISFNEQASLRNAISALLPTDARASLKMPELDRAPHLWRLCSGHLLARADVPGYGGDIRLLFTIDELQGHPAVLHRLSLLGHQETPGITDFLADHDWISGFNGRNGTEIARLATITGATITSRVLIEQLAGMIANPREALGEPDEVGCQP